MKVEIDMIGMLDLFFVDVLKVDDMFFFEVNEIVKLWYGRFNFVVVGGIGVGKLLLINVVFGCDFVKVGKGLLVI